MKVKVINKPLGPVRINDELVEWPEPGETVDLPDHIAEGMIATGTVEKASGGSTSATEKRQAQGDQVEKRPAPKKGTETRKRAV